MHATSNRKKIEWIFFDIGGVLLDDTALEVARDTVMSEAVQRFRQKPSPEELDNARMRASAKIGNLTENIIRELLPNDPAASTQAIQHARDLWKRLPDRASFSAVRPNAGKVLRALSQKYKLGIMANQPASTRGKLLGAAILSYFTHSGMSEEYGYHKPDPRLYKAVLHETGAKAQYSVMIDDNYKRGLQPAHTLGFRTVWYNLRSTPAGSSPKADWMIADLGELIDIFG